MPKDSILCARYSTNHPWRLTPDHPTSYDTQLSEVQTSPFRFKLGHSHGRYFIKNSWSMNKWTNAFPLMLQVQHTSQWNLLPAWSCYYLYLVIPSGIETSGLCLPPPSWLLHTQFSSVQLLSCVQLFATPWIAACQASLSITNSWSSLKLMSIELVMPSSHLILCRPLLLQPPIPPSIRVFSNESALCIRWPKYWSFSFIISPSNEHPGLISFRMDWLDLLAVQGTLKSLLQLVG